MYIHNRSNRVVNGNGQRVGHKCVFSHSVGEEKARVTEGHVLQQAVELLAEKGAPRTVHVFSRLCLLQTVVAVEEIVDDPSRFSGGSTHRRIGQRPC